MIENIHWFRNDLRIDDNTALSIATKSGKTICIFIVDSKLTEKAKYKSRLHFIYSSLRELKKNLRELNSDLLIFQGSPYSVLKKVFEETQVKKLFFNKDYSPFAIKRDRKIIDLCRAKNVEIFPCKDYVIFEENEVLKADKTPFKVFTFYKNSWIEKLKSNISAIKNFEIDKKNLAKTDVHFKELEFDLEKEIDKLSKFESKVFLPGEKEAQKRWDNFLESGIENYDQTRNILIEGNSSQMSAYIKFGKISVRRIVRDCIQKIKGLDNISLSKTQNTGPASYLSEIIWREFYKMIIYHFPESINENFQSKFNGISWENNKEKFNDWCNGKTGYPVVDACMRQLNETGWMSNRGRMIVASFLCKDLHIDWKWGERYFYEKLIDYDLASNVGGWQWTAGTGVDAAPYFRIFNPLEQSKKYDPDGKFIRKYIPELKLEENIHEPQNYIPKVIDHKEAINITKKIYSL